MTGYRPELGIGMRVRGCERLYRHAELDDIFEYAFNVCPVLQQLLDDFGPIHRRYQCPVEHCRNAFGPVVVMQPCKQRRGVQYRPQAYFFAASAR